MVATLLAHVRTRGCTRERLRADGLAPTSVLSCLGCSATLRCCLLLWVGPLAHRHRSSLNSHIATPSGRSRIPSPPRRPEITMLQTEHEIEQLIARVHPQPDVAASVRKLPTPATARTTAEIPIVDVTTTYDVACNSGTSTSAPWLGRQRSGADRSASVLTGRISLHAPCPASTNARRMQSQPTGC